MMSVVKLKDTKVMILQATLAEIPLQMMQEPKKEFHTTMVQKEIRSLPPIRTQTKTSPALSNHSHRHL
jgi:hypothetical protein